MYNRQQDFYGGELLGFALVLMLIAAFFVVKASLFVIKTFAQYYQHISLWIALAICVVFILVGIPLSTQVSPPFGLLPVLGVLIFLITCLVVDMRNRDTFMRENIKLIDEVLHTSWLGSEDTPVEFADEQVAA